MSRRIKKKVSKDAGSKMVGLDKLQLKIMKGLRKTKSIFQKLKIKRENKEKDIDITEKTQSEIAIISKKLENNENIFEKISRQIAAQGELISRKVARFQEVMKGLVIKQDELDKIGPSPIDGEMTVEDLEIFLSTLYENYGIMQEQYQETKEEIFLEMAMDTQLAIQEINEIKGYLIERGRYDKEFDETDI
ncbi:MAG: hypothetical protein HWN67_17755 [Candidatus Helarchaeota archaeon]|nr:hypothetical protein [Candidatus Helarchaeota archaeon]